MTGTERPSFTCPRCNRTSHHPEDAKYGYCGACHAFTGERTVPPGMAGTIVSHLGEVLPNLRPAVLADIGGAPAGDLREGAGILREYAREIGEVARICEEAAGPPPVPEPGTPS